ncbi:MAG: sensor histidine kinase [Candidatus Dormibacteria bacterium]
MRIGRGRRPRRRDPRRRFRNRLLVGMVAVALLPLVTFAVLAVLELDTIAKSTANATEAAILERQQGLQKSALGAHASSLDTRMGLINTQLGLLGSALSRALLATPVSAPLPKGLNGSLGVVEYASSNTAGTLVLPTAASANADGRFAAASATKAVLDQVAATLKLYPAITAIWFEDGTSGALRAFPVFSVSSALSAERYAIAKPGSRSGLAEFASSATGAGSVAPEAWVAPGASGVASGIPYWTEPYPLLDSGALGVTAVLPLADGQTIVGADISSDTISQFIAGALGSTQSAQASTLVVSASGTVVYATSQAFADFTHLNVGGPLVISGDSRLAGALQRMETSGSIPAAPVTATLNRVKDDVFAAPIFSAHWVMLTPVAVTVLEPNLNSLTLGVIDSVHRLFPVTVLPVLVLLVVLAFVATTLLSRRMYLPVQALTDHAVLEERTRLAREIHDTLAQQLTGIVLELEAADTLLNRGSERRAKSSVEKARELARGALQEARRSVWNLRPAPLSTGGLVAAIGHEVEAWEERTGIPARFRARAVPAHPPLSPTAEVALLRIGQEALSNAARHGKPEHVDVELRAHAQELVLSIHDDGVGFDPSASAPREDCFGLDGMAERARNAGGTLTVVSAPGSGTTVTTRLPFTETVAEAVSA